MLRLTPEEYEAMRAKRMRADVPASTHRQPEVEKPTPNPTTTLQSITLGLPYPLSANRYWRSFIPMRKDGTVGGHGRAVVTLSTEAREYKRAVAEIVIAAGITKPIAGRVAIDVRLYPALPKDWAKRSKADPLNWDDTVRSIDLDNLYKVTFDAIKGLVIEDDSAVWKTSAERMRPDGDARMEIRLSMYHGQPIVLEGRSIQQYDYQQVLRDIRGRMAQSSLFDDGD